MTHIPGLPIDLWYLFIAGSLVAFATFDMLCHRVLRRWR